MAKVDILLPYWGEVDLLKKAVESVIAQTEKDWRLFVFDDCYPSPEPASYFKSLGDTRIVYYRHAKNIGVTNNFNYALKAAQADYCVMMGCDDIMLPSYIETALSKICDADFYQPGVVVIDENDKPYLPLGDRIKRILQPRKPGMYSGEKLAISLSHGNWLYFPSILWKTKVIQRYGFNVKYGVAQDVYLEFSIIQGGAVLSFDKTRTFQYRRFAKSVSSIEKSSGKRFGEEEKVYEYFADVFRAAGWRKAARASKWHLTSRLHKLITQVPKQ